MMGYFGRSRDSVCEFDTAAQLDSLPYSSRCAFAECSLSARQSGVRERIRPLTVRRAHER